MGKIFPIVIIAVAIVGFSTSAYIFSESDISIESPITIETQNNNSVIREIETCIEQNLAGDSSIALNSFNTNMLLALKKAASEAQSDVELNEISERLHRITSCNPNNQGLNP